MPTGNWEKRQDMLALGPSSPWNVLEHLGFWILLEAVSGKKIRDTSRSPRKPELGKFMWTTKTSTADASGLSQRSLSSKERLLTNRWS